MNSDSNSIKIDPSTKIREILQEYINQSGLAVQMGCEVSFNSRFDRRWKRILYDYEKRFNPQHLSHYEVNEIHVLIFLNEVITDLMEDVAMMLVNEGELVFGWESNKMDFYFSPPESKKTVTLNNCQEEWFVDLIVKKCKSLFTTK